MNIKAKPIKPCKYPNCEECEEYTKHSSGQNFCKVPIIISKQEFLMFHQEFKNINKTIHEIEDYIYLGNQH